MLWILVSVVLKKWELSIDAQRSLYEYTCTDQWSLIFDENILRRVYITVLINICQLHFILQIYKLDLNKNS